MSNPVTKKVYTGIIDGIKIVTTSELHATVVAKIKM
jgi:hypothetical protein